MKTILSLIFILSSIIVFSQESKEPIIFGEFILGGAGKINGSGGLLIGGELNYQRKKHLFSIRYLEHIQFQKDILNLSIFLPIPIIRKKINHKEISALYGRRWVFSGSSLSVSGGLSFNKYSKKLTSKNDGRVTVTNNNFGFPFEINFKWFKSKKKKYRVYYIIPVSKPTSFG